MTLVSDSHRFIFIHVPKTGGTSVKHALGTLGSNHWVDADTASKHLRMRDLGDIAPTLLHEQFTSFAFVRNPFDQLASFWTYKMENPFHPDYAHIRRLGSFDQWVRWFSDKPRARQSAFTHDDNGNQLVDFIGRYENLEHDFAQIASTLDLPTTELPRRNTSDHPPWQQMFTDDLCDLVVDRWARDFALFGY